MGSGTALSQFLWVFLPNFTVLFNFSMHAGGQGFKCYDSPNTKLTIRLDGAGSLSICWPSGVQLVVFFCSSVFTCFPAGLRIVTVESSSLLHHSLFTDFSL